MSVQPTSASAGNKVTITVKPDSGYDVGEVTVTDKSGKEITVTNVGDGKYTFIMPQSKVDVKVEFVRQQTLPTFTDVQSGADDYVTKPFSLAVLRARVNARLRREAPAQTDAFRQDGFSFDFTGMEFSRDGVPVELSKTEQKLLRLLVCHRGTTLSRGALIDRIWTDGAAYVDGNALSVAVKRLRDKLEDDPSRPRYLKTVYGIGYTWAVT